MAVTVECGVNSTTAELAGQKACDIRTMLRQPLNIDPAAATVVNGEAVRSEYVAQDGDVIEFVKRSGQKGDRR